MSCTFWNITCFLKSGMEHSGLDRMLLSVTCVIHRLAGRFFMWTILNESSAMGKQIRSRSDYIVNIEVVDF